MSTGIVGWGVYLPYWRLDRAAIAAALGSPAGRGTRTVASFDEDTTTLAVEAARVALGAPGTPRPESILFSTPSPGYLDKTNATTVHAALGLPGHVAAYDATGSPRSAQGALRAALSLGQSAPAMAIVSDVRTGLAGGTEERDAGDGAVALICGSERPVAELIGTGSASEEFLDRWRAPDEGESHQWEERFGEEVYVPLALAAWTDALKAAGIGAEAVDYVAVAGLHARAVKTTTAKLGVAKDALVSDHAATVGNLGAAQAAYALADVLDRAEPGQVVALVSLADGADVFLFRTTDALPAAQAARRDAAVSTGAQQEGEGRTDLPYTRFLTWRGQLHREPPRRPDPERPGAPTVWRSEEWKYGFTASRCLQCGFRHLPPTRVCLKCQSVDQMELERLADVQGTVATFTVDHLAFSLSPPVVGVVVDFDGGGRYRCEMTDVDPTELHIGTRVQMTFRRVYTASGVHNYFWKAMPVRGAAPSTTGGAASAKEA